MNTTRNELNAANLEAGQLALELLDLMEGGIPSDSPELDGHWDIMQRRLEEVSYLRSELPATTDWRQVWPEGAE